ncbi:MAG: GNAT family N-acetyltransferase [Bacilli bacterium]|nr:GNAT family N-acetyltransferase [Bacilli bacterium]
MINNNGTKLVNTERTILRKFKTKDALSFFENVGGDAEVSKYVVWNRHENVEVTKRAINKWIENYEKDNVYYWAVELKETNEIIGSISCVNVDLKNATCELGYVYGSKFWNKGYATEVLKAVINYLMKEEGFYTIYAQHLSLNPASGRVLEKSGMVYEGRLKNRIIDKNTGIYDDLLSYSICAK